jgi:predicted permease
MQVRVLRFPLAAALLAGVPPGICPAVRAATSDPHATMRRRGLLPGGRSLAGSAMLAGEVALALVLLVGGGLLLRSLANVLERDVGYSADGVAAAQVVLTPPRFGEDTLAAPAFWQTLLDFLQRDPSIAHAALANWVPTGTGGTSFLEVEGVEGRHGAAYRVVSDDYFETMRMPIARGRAFADVDAARGERVAVISRSLAQKYWPDVDPIGARIRTPGMEGYDDVQWLRVIGVTSDVRHGGHESETSDHVYVLQRQRPEHRALHVLVRTADNTTARAASSLEQAVLTLDASLAVEPRDLERELASLTAERRLITSILAVFALLSLLLATTGIYGLFSYAVAQRTHEIGVRSALGADRTTIIRLVLGDALRVVMVGCVGGVIGAYWITQLIESQLEGVTTRDPITYGIAFSAIVVAALLAALLPGVRAARIDPQVALRST